MTFQISPGVYPRIIDLSQGPTITNPSIAAAVGGAHRGPLNPTYVTSLVQRIQLYGKNDPTVGYLLDSCDAYLSQGTQLWMNRVVANDAKWSVGLISNNSMGGQPFGTSFTTIPYGSDSDYTQVNRTVTDIEFVGTWVSGDSIIVTINGVSSSSIPWSVDHNTTMEAIAQAIQTMLDGMGSGGLAWLVPNPQSNYQTIRLIGPEAITVLPVVDGVEGGVSVDISGSGTPPTSSIYEADWLAFVVAENPGSWSAPGNGNVGVACGISAVDKGIPQRVTLSFSQACVTGNTFSITINGADLEVPFNAISSNQTMQDIATAYVNAFPTGSASVVNANAGISGNRQIVLVAPDSSTLLDITNISVSGGVSRPIISYAVTLDNTPSTGQFTFVVYDNNATFASPDEVYTCTYENGVNGLGAPLGFEYVINHAANAYNSTSGGSPSVNVTVNPLFSGTVNGITYVTNSNYERFLEGGQDGSLVSSSQVINGWSAFSNPEKITIRILINCGYSTPEVQKYMVNLAAARMDCICILDIPSDQQTSSNAANYRNNVMNIASYWGAAYSPDILIYDSNLGARRYVPPSGYVSAQYAYTDKNAAEWFAPAGLNRGVVAAALDLRYHYDEGDRDMLSSAQVNAIRKFGPAFPIWGEYTLQPNMSALQSVPVVRLIITIIAETSSVVAYSLFEPNNQYTWHKIRVAVNALLDPIEVNQGLDFYYVQCDASNNTPATIDARICKVAIWILPTLAILYIRLDVVVTRHAANFSVELAASNGQY